MNFSAGLSLFTNLILKHLGSVFGCHTDSSIRICNTISFSNLTTMILVSDFLKLYNTHTGKPLAGISPIGMGLMFSEYILGQYRTQDIFTNMWLAGLRKNMKSCQIKGSLNS